ncbi:MAG TPA: type V CRISPR-associated protein Cas12b [Verrucomicrobiae bacterium]|nr:type V CRISPR-associated protein Cas12b [Verrucomicrobiae bacterium]
MNRIYQGRVIAVELPDGKDELGNYKWKKLDEWQTAIWNHHELFQDAINYYILALASLADPQFATMRLIKDLRARVSAAWIAFPRPVEDARSLGQSVANWLGLAGNALPEEAFDAVLKGNEATPQVRALALALLLDRCGGESAIQQGGRGYLPRFCDSKAKPTYDFSAVSQAAGVGKDRLSQILHGQAQENELAEIANEIDLSWTVKLQPGEFFTPEESSARLIEAIEHVRGLLRDSTLVRLKEVATQFPDFDEQLNSFKKSITDDLQKFMIPRNRKASKDLTFATLAFKFFPCSLTGKVLSLFIKKPKAGPAEKPKNNVDFGSCGDDPIKLARGNRGFVFRAFTALPAWNPTSPGDPIWKEFDIAAFKEALKSLNQFNQETQERIDNENNLRGQLAILMGSEIKGWKPRKTETNEDESIPEPLEPELFQLARELEIDLTQELADTVVGSESLAEFGEASYKYREGEWLLSSASLRGYRDIAEEWNNLHLKRGATLSSDDLENVVKKHQRDDKNKKSIGSVPLFLKLCEKKYWPLWLLGDAGDGEFASENLFLESMVLFHSKIRDFERSLEPINLTPAEPKHSRRLYMFSDLTDKTAKVIFGKTDERFIVECAIAVRAGDKSVKEQRVRLFYSAKRLLRDELQGGVESRWLQPMTRALGLTIPQSASVEMFESAVSLMPDVVPSEERSKTEWRFLLNFPVTLDPVWIHSGLGKAAMWKGQFNGTREKSLHLHWPGTIKEKANAVPWWENKQNIEKGFSCLSVDLGQRTAGAGALLRVTCWDPRKGETGTKRPVREVGFDGERAWFAEVFSTGIFRLPGEDQKVLGLNGDREVERSGKSGRNALESEWKNGKELARALFAENPENWLGKSFEEKSFPEQNDALIALANRRLSRLNTFHRWSCFNPDRPEVAARRSGLIKKLGEELEHWEDAEVQTWKKSIKKGDFEAFRLAAGEAFRSLRLKLEEHLLTLANRVAPLRDRSWLWDRTKKNADQGLYGELLDSGNQLTDKSAWLRGQRGLSLARIEQLENLRRLFLRYNRSFDREAGTPAKFGREDRGRKSGEPCLSLLEKIERMKKQRVNQTAHLILAEALGIRLRKHQIDEQERQAKDVHGEYEKIPGRAPVDFIVIENLDRYLTSQGRSPSENSRLMKWAHRAVRDKIKMLAEEPFGIPVVEAPAAYSSRFCAVSGVAGARCEERTALDPYAKESLEKWANRPRKPGQPDPKVFTVLLNQFEQLEKLNQQLKMGRIGNEGKSNSLHTLFVPKQGGPLFLSLEELGAKGRAPKQADINAAINIGLRSIAGPTALDILHKIRAEKEGSSFRPTIKNAREKVAFNSKSLISLKGKASDKLSKARSPNFFFDARAFGCFDSATLKLADRDISLVSGVGLWSTVNQIFPGHLAKLNERRLTAWQKMASNQDNVLM